MKDLLRLVRAMSEVLAAEESATRSLARLIAQDAAGALASLHADLEAANTNARRPVARQSTQICVIPIRGAISHHDASGGTSTDEIAAQLTMAVGSPQIDAILLDVDSPGGTIDGVPELADRIYAARETKPIVAIANGLMASAAYWIASAAGEVVVTPSGQVGSIGVLQLHEDWSKALDQEGVKITVISAGKFKTEGAPWGPLSAEAENFRRQRVEEVYGWFVKAVAVHRRDSQANVRSGYGEGRVLGATQAVNAKLADRVGTFEETIERLARKVDRAARRGSSAAMLGRHLALDADPLA